MRNALSAKELGYLANQLYFVLDAGIPVSRGLGLIRPHRRREPLLNELGLGMRRGESLRAALERTGVFPKFFVYMAQVGEESGMLADIMRRLAAYYEKESRMADELKSAMLYPIIVSALMLGVIVAAMLLVVPNYARIFEANGVELPAITAILIQLSGFVVRHIRGLAVGVPVLLMMIAFSLSTGPGEAVRHRLLLLSKIHCQSLNQKFAQALELLLLSGNDLARAVDIAKHVLDNRFLEAELQTALEHMLRGTAFSDALGGAKHIDGLLVTMIRLGEETGRLPQTIGKCADYLQKDLDTRVVRLNKLIEPVITLVLGGMLAFVMLAIMLPTFQMANIL